MDNQNIYSYHTFILPFIWEGSSANKHSLKEFVGCFNNNPNWKCVDITDEFNMVKNCELVSKEDAFLYYKEYQYFHPYVRKAIYGFNSGIVTNFIFMPDRIRNKAHYYIEKYGRKYDLLINSIKLKIYNTGVALFIMECENHGVDANGISQANFEDVKNINDYGRRISLPFMPLPSDFYSICADRLSICIDGIAAFEDNFKDYAIKIADTADVTNNMSMTHMCDYIKNILGFGSDTVFTSKQNEENEKYYIYPALDDRMFVACCVTDKDVADSFRYGLPKDKYIREYAYKTDEKLSKSLYEFIFVDPDNGCTCPNRDFRHRLIDEHLYTRWMSLKDNPDDPDETDYGTIYSIACQSLTMLLNANLSYMIETFLTQYIQMSCLVLVQRATLIHFQREASALSANIEESGKQIDKLTIMKLMNLQERFVAYQSQLYFTEVSPQEQAIELYDMFRKFMFIEQENESLKNRIERLQDAADTSLDFGFNKIALVFTLVSFALALCQDIMCFVSGDGQFFGFSNTLMRGITLGSVALLIIPALAILLKYRRRK